jgi:hypothetical protein
MGIHGDVRTFHLVLGDWAFGTSAVGEDSQADRSDRVEVDHGREWRIGQMPNWLDASLLGLERRGLSVKVHHHAEIFKDRTAVGEEAALRYRREALPNFNSCALSCFLGNRSQLTSTAPCSSSAALQSRPSSSISPAWRPTSSSSTTTSS